MLIVSGIAQKVSKNVFPMGSHIINRGQKAATVILLMIQVLINLLFGEFIYFALAHYLS